VRLGFRPNFTPRRCAALTQSLVLEDAGNTGLVCARQGATRLSDRRCWCGRNRAADRRPSPLLPEALRSCSAFDETGLFCRNGVATTHHASSMMWRDIPTPSSSTSRNRSPASGSTNRTSTRDATASYEFLTSSIMATTSFVTRSEPSAAKTRG
jgi:hypothetical protein